MIATPAIQQQSTRTAALVSVRTPATAPRTRMPSVSDTLPVLERTLHTLLSPLEFSDWKSWQRAVHERLLELTGADALCVYTPLADGADAWLSPHLSETALCE